MNNELNDIKQIDTRLTEIEKEKQTLRAKETQLMGELDGA